MVKQDHGQNGGGLEEPYLLIGPATAVPNFQDVGFKRTLLFIEVVAGGGVSIFLGTYYGAKIGAALFPGSPWAAGIGGAIGFAASAAAVVYGAYEAATASD